MWWGYAGWTGHMKNWGWENEINVCGDGLGKRPQIGYSGGLRFWRCGQERLIGCLILRALAHLSDVSTVDDKDGIADTGNTGQCEVGKLQEWIQFWPIESEILWTLLNRKSEIQKGNSRDKGYKYRLITHSIGLNIKTQGKDKSSQTKSLQQ